MAYFTCSRSRDRVKVREVFLFCDAVDLQCSLGLGPLLELLGGDAGDETPYSFTWTDEAGNEAYKFQGSHYHKKEIPPRHDQYHLGLAAEEMWSQHLLRQALPRFRAGQSYTCKLEGNDKIVFQQDVLELHLNGKVHLLYPEDLREMRFADHLFTLKEPGVQEGWFTSRGVHTFSYWRLANARLFVMLMQELYLVEFK
jgi:hypothetical protein